MKRMSRQIMAMLLALSMTVTPAGYVFAQADDVSSDVQAEPEQVNAAAAETKAQESEPAAPESDAAVPEGEITVPESESTAPESDVTVPESDTIVPESDAIVPESDATVPESEVTAPEGEVTAPQSEAAADAETEGEAVSLFEISKIESKAAQDNQITVSIYTENMDFSRIYIGKKEDVEKTPEVIGVLNELGGYTFTFDLSDAMTGQELTLVPYIAETEEWYVEEDVKFTVPEPEMLIADETMQNALSGEMESALITAPMLLTVDALSADIVNGDYTTEVESSAAMFKVTDCVLTSKDGVYSAVITLSGTGYDYLYVGTAQAAAEDSQNWIQYVADAEGKYIFTVPVSDLDVPISIAAHSAKKDTWYDRTLTFKSETMVKIPVQLEDGDYTTNVASNNKMFKVVDCVINSKDGAMQAVITLSGTGYDYLYIGTAEAAQADAQNWIRYVADAEGKYTFTVPVSDLDVPIAIAAHSASKDKWYDRELTFASDSLSKKYENGDYSVSVESDNKMFKIVNCVLTNKDGEYSAVITMSGTGYDKLYMGSAQNAVSDSENWITYVADAEGKYTFTVPVEDLDTEIQVAAHAVKSDSWKDRVLIFKSEGMEIIEDETESDQPGDTKDPEDGEQTDDTQNPEDGEQTDDTEKPDDTTADTESKYESDLSGSTSRVDSSTALADGVYSPDKFTWGGGSGRVSISCNKVTVKNGQAYATIVFDSDAYSYIKANGNKYYGSNGGGTSTFVIPVALNQNNTILGMTTKMSASHEVAYSIYIYIAGADKAESAATGDLTQTDQLSEEAPNVMGFEFEEEIQLDYAQYFKMYSYEQGVTLLEIDMKEGTGRTGEEVIEKDPSEDVQDAEGTEETAESSDASDLYLNNVIKYLIVPEGVEVPVGLDKEVIIITLPADQTYSASEEAIEMMSQIEALENIAAVDVEAGDCQTEALKAAIDNGDVVFAGAYDALDYKTLVAEKVNFAIMPDEMLPEEDASLEESAEKLTMISEVSESLSLLGIPMMIDRSDDEEDTLAKLEWIKIYGILFGCEDAANKMFEEAVKAAE